MSGFIDIHNHLQEEVLAPHVEALMTRARIAGIVVQLVNGTHEGDWPDVESLARTYADLLPCFGLHPWFVPARDPHWLERLQELLEAYPAAVGEIGLDRWMPQLDLPAQEAAFVAQLRLAKDLGRPIMIHCLRAWGWLLELLEREKPLPPLLIHAYGGATELIRPLAQYGAYFSFGGSVFEEKRARMREALRAVPLDRLLVETDAPALLPPEPYRPYVTQGEGGELLNEPANLPVILEGIAALRGLSPTELKEIVWENAQRLLGELWPLRRERQPHNEK